MLQQLELVTGGVEVDTVCTVGQRQQHRRGSIESHSREAVCLSLYLPLSVCLSWPYLCQVKSHVHVQLRALALSATCLPQVASVVCCCCCYDLWHTHIQITCIASSPSLLGSAMAPLFYWFSCFLFACFPHTHHTHRVKIMLCNGNHKKSTHHTWSWPQHTHTECCVLPVFIRKILFFFFCAFLL